MADFIVPDLHQAFWELGNGVLKGRQNLISAFNAVFEPRDDGQGVFAAIGLIARRLTASFVDGRVNGRAEGRRPAKAQRRGRYRGGHDQMLYLLSRDAST